MNTEPPCSDSRQQLAALRLQGAHRFDPVRFHYLEVLAQRAQGQPERVQKLLQARLAHALAEWNSRREAAHSASPQHAEPAVTPSEAPTPLNALARYLAQHASESAPDALAHASPEGATATRPELRSVRHFRKTWSRLSADRQLNQALHQAPQNAGPINSHLLVLRSLALMRDISPDYLDRFMSYADTLLGLEQGIKAPRSRP